MIGLQAVLALMQQFFPEIAEFMSHLGIFGHEHGHGHGHSHGAVDLGPNINAAWLAGGSILIKEWLYRATMKVAKEKRSSVLASNAYHHRVDSLTAFVALLTITASHFLTNAQWLDPVGGLVISGMIVQAGYGNTKAALLELADVGIDDEIKHKVEDAARAALTGSEADATAVQGVKSGQNFLIEVAVNVPESWKLSQLTELEDKIREEIGRKVKSVKRVAVRFNSSEAGGDAFQKTFLNFDQSNAEVTEEHDHDPDHDHGHDHGHGHSTSNNSNGSAKPAINKQK